MMDSREIDRLVAEKVMGWEAGKYAYGSWFPTTNIADAWKVVDKIKESRFSIRKRFIDELQKEVTPEETKNRGNLVDKGWMIFLMTPKDICLAALKAYGIEVEI